MEVQSLISRELSMVSPDLSTYQTQTSKYSKSCSLSPQVSLGLLSVTHWLAEHSFGGASSHIPEASASEQWREYFSLKTDSQSERRHVWTLSPPTVALMTRNTGHSAPPCLTARTVCKAPGLQHGLCNWKP